MLFNNIPVCSMKISSSLPISSKVSRTTFLKIDFLLMNWIQRFEWKKLRNR